MLPKTFQSFIHNKHHFFLILFFILNIFSFSFCSESCPSQVSIGTNTCFNDVLKFDSKKYRAGHFVTYKNGDMIVEFSDDDENDSQENYGYSRIFYGLKENGRYFFPNERPIWEIENIGKIDSARGRYESLNQIVLLENDIERKNEYLFSTSSYDSLTELHIIQNQTYIYEKTSTFLGKNNFAFRYSMVEVIKDNQVFYFIGFTHSSTDKQLGDRLDIKKIGFKSYSLNDINYYADKTIDNNQDNRIINLFIIKDFDILVLVYIRNDNYLKFKFYDYSLTEQGSEQSLFYITMERNGDNARDRNGVFFKSVELPENRRAFALYDNGIADILYFKIYQFSQNENSYSGTETLSLGSRSKKEYRFLSYVTFNDIYKINDRRIAVVSVSANKEELVLLMYDLYNDYKNIKMRWYLINIKDIGLKKELSLYTYNDYLLFTITGSNFADLIIFGYANGTDTVINISPYLENSLNFNAELNLITEIFNNLTIDNNIFDYETTNTIKIISIPEEIKFYKKEGDNDVEINNNDIIEKTISYSLIQDKEKTKTFKYYDFYYQFIIKEKDYTNFYSNAHFTYDYAQDNNNYNNYQNDFEQKTFYGRTNKISFKLCHDYCNTCNEIGYDINHQKCVTCLPEYTFDYWNYFNNTYSSNCVPFDYMNLIEQNIVVKCNTQDYKFYFNKTKNATICFLKNYECPWEYHYFNITNNECTDFEVYVPSTAPHIPSTEPYIPSTIPKIPSTTPLIPSTAENIPSTEPFKPSTVIEKNPSTIINSPSTQYINQKTTILINPSTIISLNNSGICSYNIYISTTCAFDELTEVESYKKIKDEIISTFPSNGQSLSIPTKNDYSFLVRKNQQLIDFEQLFHSRNALSILELGDCEQKLKEEYNINDITQLLIFTYEKTSGSTVEKDIQYEIIDPNTNTKLDLSICKDNNVNINIYIPIKLNEKETQLYNEVNEQEYDLLDLNSKFYTDICTPFTSDRNTDILLVDRINYYYSKIISETTCPNNCELLFFISKNNILKCKCEINNEPINTAKINNKHKNPLDFFKFLDDYKYTSYKTMKCYKLVFDSEIFGKNAGSILLLLFFIAYLAFMGLYFYKNISPFKTIISKIIQTNNKNNSNENLNIFNLQTNKKKKRQIGNAKKDETNNLNPPKKSEKSNSEKSKEKENDIEVVKYKNKNKDENFEIHSIKSGQNVHNKSKENIETENVLNINSKNDSENNENNKILFRQKLDNYELNKLDFINALLLDNRNFLTIYLSYMKREQLIWFTFISWDDYNIFYVKISRFLILLATEMTMNALLFSDKSVHKLYIEHGTYNFGESLPGIIYSILITHALEILLCYLSMIDIHIYEIKSLKKSEQTTERINDILKMIKIKLIIFFSFGSLIFLFYWYCVSAFCAVYQNTQGFLILNSFFSFLFELIDPFIFYALFTLLRKISFKYQNIKAMVWMYKISKFFPIF